MRAWRPGGLACWRRRRQAAMAGGRQGCAAADDNGGRRKPGIANGRASRGMSLASCSGVRCGMSLDRCSVPCYEDTGSTFHTNLGRRPGPSPFLPRSGTKFPVRGTRSRSAFPASRGQSRGWAGCKLRCCAGDRRQRAQRRTSRIGIAQVARS
jgi:hypothetical protein